MLAVLDFACYVTCAFACCCLFGCVAFGVLVLYLRRCLDAVRERQGQHKGRLVGFLHPHSTGGGGGERVLWAMLKVLMAEWPEDTFLIYTHWTGEGAATNEELKKLVLKKFGIELTRPIELVELSGVKWVESSTYPRLTLLFQSLGAVPLAWEALRARVPDVFVDTMGLAFAYPLARFCGRCRVACYTHYPVVSSDMLSVVRGQTERFNNSGVVARSQLLSTAKVLYYRVFAEFYGWAGRHSHVIMVNSSWTKNHIMQVWRLPSSRVQRVYPPCDVTKLLELGHGDKECMILSVAQFRPEKDHSLQLRAFQKLAQRWSDPALKLHLVGGVRNKEDRDRVTKLESEVEALGLSGRVAFHVDLPFPDMLKLLDRASIGLHTMWCEHFGIGVVEYMAAGCIPLAHNSGGPKEDIVVEGSGHLAGTEDEYAAKMEAILSMTKDESASMRAQARKVSQRFSEEKFAEGVRSAFAAL